MEQIPVQNQEVDLRAKQRARRIIAFLYQVEQICFYLYLVYVGLLLLILLSGVIFMRMAWGMFILGGAVPWLWILPLSLFVAFVFPLADSFIQSSEEQWFARYGTTILASVAGFDAVKGFSIRFFAWGATEYRVRLSWRQPDTERMYSYSLRVRDQRLPRENSPLPVTIDYDDPAYYLKGDIKDPSLLI